jgi:hypothetical protein
MVPPHVRQLMSDTAEAFPTSVWQLEHRRIEASQEIVVTTKTLKLRRSELLAQETSSKKHYFVHQR